MLYLVGFMGVGKTTIGKQIASQLKINFVDIDEAIEVIANQSILDIFQYKGENYFRKLETNTLTTISKNNVVACGGGLPAYNNNMHYIRKSGKCIYLKASEEEIFKRLSKNTKIRPLIHSKCNDNLKSFIRETLAVREKFYLMADYTIDTSHLSEKDVLRKINALPISI